jgi:molecular chaperone HtpG
MYIDPLTIYREYIQNAADSIENARQVGLLASDERGRVDIHLDPEARSVRLRDNGSGLDWKNFVSRLSALGMSNKRGTAARGFRGVGRLAGLGYAQELIFRSRTQGETLVSEMRWDCRQLRAKLRTAQADNGLARLISSIVSVSRIDGNNYPERFFEVELRGVVRLRSDKLMSGAAIAEYLGQVAPVGFSPEFHFGAEITAVLGAHVQLGEIEIQISGLDTPVFRPHRDAIGLDDKRSIRFESVEFVQVPGIDGDVAAVAWVLHHDYEGAIPSSQVKGIRLRSGNIQVGDHTLLEELFPEHRFNAWAVGEVHVVDRRIVPNGRRDYFEQNVHLHNLLNHLTPTARGIARRCRTNSVRRKWLRQFEIHNEAISEKLDIIKQGTLVETERNAVALSAKQVLLQMEKIAGMDLLVEDASAQLRATVESRRQELDSVIKESSPEKSPLAHLPAERQAMYQHLFSLIYECSQNRSAAKSLVDRILLKIA